MNFRHLLSCDTIVAQKLEYNDRYSNLKKLFLKKIQLMWFKFRKALAIRYIPSSFSKFATFLSSILAMCVSATMLKFKSKQLLLCCNYMKDSFIAYGPDDFGL